MRSFLLDALRKGTATIAPPGPDAAALGEAAQALGERARQRLGRSLAIREIDAGSCNGCELEIHAISNPLYDVERFGLKFVASPRHADVLLVTGPVTWNMREALLRTYNATPEPKWVVALGDCAINCGVFAGSPASIAASSPVHRRWSDRSPISCRSTCTCLAVRRRRSRSSRPCWR